jgi:phospholipase/carboxylesterase
MTQRLETVELQTGNNPTAAVIWLHGLGADGNDFVPVVNELDLNGAPAIRFVFPHAPMIPVTINNGYVMRAWYDVTLGDLETGARRADEKGVRQSQAQIGELIEREVARAIPHKNIVLAGFSQGGAIALQTGLRYAQKLAGVMSLSSYLPCADSFDAEATAANKTTPLFIAHGTDDPMVPYSRGSATRDLLMRSGYSVEWHEYAMAHAVCLAEVRDIGAWLKSVLRG